MSGKFSTISLDSLVTTGVTSDKPVHRKFVAWDGEGITHPGDVQQSYVLFGASTGDRIRSKNLGTRQCLNLILRVEEANREAIHVGFSISYDANMILKDLPNSALRRVWAGRWTRWQGFRIQWLAGKWFSVSRGRKAQLVHARIFDVFGFFQSSFLAAVTEFLPADDPEVARIRAGKKLRRVFSWQELDSTIVPYWEQELRMLVQIMDALRADLESAGFWLSSWHGPGAVANRVFLNWNIQKAKSDDILPVISGASRLAYAGGRFEQFRVGHHNSVVWEYDIRSAYPSIIRKLPNLSGGSWRFAKDFEPDTFAVWKIAYNDISSVRGSRIGGHPFFHRDKNGLVSFPPLVDSWAWTPEAAFSPESVRGGWVFDPADPDDLPFAFVEDFYLTRRKWKEEGNSAQRALKLALNSLYGKMAQRKGWKEGGKKPTWHQLEWAGYITSAVRAMLWEAYISASESIVAMETDALFSTRPLSLPVGAELGEWEVTKFEKLTYIQSGFYYGELPGGEVVTKYRGFDKECVEESGSLHYRAVLDYLDRKDGGSEEGLFGYTTRFVGYPLASRTRAIWRTWNTTPRQIHIGGGGKRNHIIPLCAECSAGIGLNEALHHTALTTQGGQSYPHPLPWEKGPMVGFDDLVGSGIRE
jgi:hypothetical protein